MPMPIPSASPRNRIWLAAAALLFSVTCVQAAPEAGRPAPGFSATDSRGQTHSLVDYRGKTVVLEWTNHDCPYVQKHYDSGNMQALQREAAAQGAIWLSVISSAPGKQGHIGSAQADQLTRDRKAAPSAVLLDSAGAVGRLYGAKTTPHLYVIDAKGTLVYMGGIDDRATTDTADIPGAKNYVRAALASMKAGRPVAEAVTRPYGCSVKY
jgi:peroxiredoxin